jgi:predicted P-loop ATPase
MTANPTHRQHTNGDAAHDATDLDHHTIQVTFIANKSGTKLKSHTMTLPELQARILTTRAKAKLELGWLKLATFGDVRSEPTAASKGHALRHDANVLTIDGIELDFDGAHGTVVMSLDEAIETLRRMNVRTLIYTTPSSTADKPRWRILMPFSESMPLDPLSSPKVRKEMRAKFVARVNGYFGNIFAHESFTLSQGFVYGHLLDKPDIEAIIIDGDFIDQRNDLQRYEANGRKTIKADSNKADGKKTNKFETLLSTVGDGEGRAGFRENIRDAIGSYVATHGSGLDRETLKVIIRNTIDNAPKDKDRDPASIDRYKSDTELDSLIEGAIARGFGNKADVAEMFPWRETKPNRSPLPSMHNARLAITKLGIECRYDTFHNTILLGYKDDDVQHQLHSIVGEVSDNAVMALRQKMSERFGLDFTERFTRDAVISLALEHCFDPVCDMLDQAEANWDGVERLDRMAVDYFNCENTPLNRAFVRKMMIGAVHRARVPGCKFDTIAVFESDEGWNKSSALNELAGDDNFSDESILGKGSREVQEQLATVWIHENADLAGMRKAEVESVKSFASRRVDIARPAYGHLPKKQKRHSIEVGTTNAPRYLQSQTGNRRFWPLKVLKSIDLVKLREDRLQLWGEAAKSERGGESVALDEALWATAGEAQEQRRMEDPWEIKLAEYSDWGFVNKTIVHVAGNQARIATLTLLEDVLGIHQAKDLKQNDTMRLSNVMRSLGWKKPDNKIYIDGKQVRGFYREWIDQDLLDAIRTSRDPSEYEYQFDLNNTYPDEREYTVAMGKDQDEILAAAQLRASGKQIDWVCRPHII